ncbi:MAG: aminotransferase class III-fold pyridoxal phosphate-dependent enzyme [Acetobacteraceae bacterium]|nr:aminotransferase class III-fold pyridoxal phosphate-dependent enzyme [Acetobacteraceae bacterium]
MSAKSRMMMARRERLLGPNNPIFYDNPVHFVRGEGVWLFDAEGRRFLDAYNNVPHVGHCHPAVVDAITRQAGLLNTHSRYLHDGVLDYAERLLGTFHRDLSTILFTCTGSEANDVALRMARSITGKRGIIVTDFTYHGNTTAVMELATLLPKEEGFSSHIRTIPAPDSYHLEPGEKDETDMAARVLSHLDAAIESLEESGHGVAGILLCPIFANEGFPDLPAGFLDKIAKRVRRAGGVVIADEVQSGFGRTGGAMWGHQFSGFVPDIATMGKPMGNGHPIGGVVTTREIMHAFRTKNLYFNTFGSNPVSCAAGMAVLDVIENERLMQNAEDVGAYAKDKLRTLATKYGFLGDVRGAGLFFGVEFIEPGPRLKANKKLAKRAVNMMRENGVIMGLIGKKENLFKIRPPMPFTRANVDYLDEVMRHVFSRL